MIFSSARVPVSQSKTAETSSLRSCVVFRNVELDRLDGYGGKIVRRKPVIDKNIPNFSENPDYINNIVYHKEQ